MNRKTKINIDAERLVGCVLLAVAIFLPLLLFALLAVLVSATLWFWGIM